MTTYSQNGWPCFPPDRTDLTVDGVTFDGVRSGDVFTIFQNFVQRYVKEVEPLVPNTCGCYNPKVIPGSSVWSNHASATAIDINWGKHPLHVKGTFTPSQRNAVERLVSSYNGVIRWGGNYVSSTDEMHFEINTGVTDVHVCALNILNAQPKEDTMSALDAVNGLMTVLAEAANASLPDNAPGKQPTTQNGRNARVFIRTILAPDLQDETDEIIAAIKAHTN
jgi:hypothetical protein